MPASPAVSETGEQMYDEQTFGATEGGTTKSPSPLVDWVKDSLLAMWGRWLRPADHTDNMTLPPNSQVIA